MAWKRKTQFVHQYSTDGSSNMVWQPAMVYESNKPKGKSLSFDRVLNLVSFLLALAAAFVTYHQVGMMSYVEHLSSGTRQLLSGCSAALVMILAIIICTRQSFRLLLGVGVTIFCAGLLIFPLISFF